MVKKFNKKAAVEMSLNLIIMLIIGMVVLGLVIGFVNSLVNKGTEGFDRQLGDNEKLKLDKVKSASKNLAIEPNPSFSVKKGSKTNLFIKVRAYSDEIKCNPGELNDCDTSIVQYEVLGDDGTSKQDDLILTGPGFNAVDGEDDSKMYTIKTAPTTKLGTYYLIFKLYPNSEFETSETLTIEVN